MLRRQPRAGPCRWFASRRSCNERATSVGAIRPRTGADGQEGTEHCLDSQKPELTFLLVRALPDSLVVVVRDRIELSTFRFSGGLSSREHFPRKGSNSPAHAHRRWRPAVLRAFNTHNKCTGVCRSVRGVSVGIGRRVAGLWGFCGGSQERLTGPADPTAPGEPCKVNRSVHEALKMVSRCHSRNSLEGRSARRTGRAIGCRARS